MASRIPTIDFARLNAPAEPPPDFSRTDGRDHSLKQELKAAKSIVSCVLVDGTHRLQTVPYPCDDANDPIPLCQLPSYASTHVWLQNIHCFCEVLYGTRRQVRILSPYKGESAGNIVLGCSKWKKHGKASKGGQEFCLYWLNLTELCSSDRFAAALQLQAYPVAENAFVGKGRANSNDKIRRILSGSGGPSSSQESGYPTSSQEPRTPPSSQASAKAGAATATSAAQSREPSMTSNDSTVIIPSDPIQRRAQAKRKIQLFMKKPAIVRKARTIAGPRMLPVTGPVIDISDESSVPAPPNQLAQRRVDEKASALTRSRPGLKPAKAVARPSGAVFDASSRREGGVSRAAIPSGKAVSSRKRTAAAGDEEVIVISSDDDTGRAGSSSGMVLKTTAAKSSKRVRLSDSRGAVEGHVGTSPSSQSVGGAVATQSEPTLYMVDGSAPGSQGTAFIAFTGARGETFYELDGKK